MGFCPFDHGIKNFPQIDLLTVDIGDDMVATLSNIRLCSFDDLVMYPVALSRVCVIYEDGEWWNVFRDPPGMWVGGLHERCR